MRKGFKVVTIIDPGVKEDKGYYVYDEGVENGYFAKTPEGKSMSTLCGREMLSIRITVTRQYASGGAEKRNI